jgi:glycosyltransferase involved in cell wall biosynthesis
MVDFSLVCPVNREKQMLLRTLPSFYQVEPSEVILCFDKEKDEETYDIARQVTQRFPIETRFLFIDKNPDFKWQLPWIRLEGLRSAKHDRILTVDADLVINKNVLKALRLVGQNNVGLVSCSKDFPQKELSQIWRAIARKVVGFVYPWQFSGLYAFWRPYWLDIDEGIKSLPKPDNSSDMTIGDDVYIRDCIKRHHRAIHLRNICAVCVSACDEDKPTRQFQAGRYYAEHGYSIFQILLKSLLYLRFYVLLGWLYEKRNNN